MSFKGRGRFFKLSEDEEEDTQTQNKTLKSDVSNKGGEYRRVGRGKLLDDISSSCSSLSLSGGRGRAYLFECLSKFECTTETSQSDSKLESKDSTFGTKDNSKEYSFFKPPLTCGNKGTPVKLACNYIKVTSNPNKGVYVYEVRFIPSVDSVNLRMKYLNEHKDKFGVTKSFDGETLYLPILLKEKLTTFVSRNIADSSDIEIRILYKRKETLKNCIQLYNILFDRVMKTLNYVRFDRKQFDPSSPKVIPHAKLEVWPGYITAVEEYEGGLMLCCDVSHRLLCQKTVLESLVDIFHCNPNMFHENAKKALIGSVVITRYNNRTYRIDDICFDKSPGSTFQTKQCEISYFEYYQRNYNIKIKDKNQPLLISIKKRKSSDIDQSEDFVFCLIPEICYLTGLRDEIRSDYKLMREIATFTRVTPSQRICALEKFFNNINDCSEARDILGSWGLTLNRSYETVNGRQLDEEKVYFGKCGVGVGINANFSKHATRSELFEVVNLQDWLLIYTKKDTKSAKIFTEQMFRNTRCLGISVQAPKTVTLDNDRIENYVNALRNNIDKHIQIVVCICSASREDRYAAIKKICCAEIPIPSQVINANTLLNEKTNRSIVQKIALQMNCKLGGALWTLHIPFKSVMICGIDTYHDISAKGNSVAAFVASLNSTYTKWYSKAIIQSNREEIVNGLCSSFIAALLAFENTNGKLPDSVIIYRDGVGDGQLQLCDKYEINQLENACKKSFSKYLLKLTFIVVQKRINTRYFSTKLNSIDNPIPGTVIDSIITRSHLYDFFLVSQSVQQGTVSPTHYIVLKDDSTYKPDIIQRLTYKLCYLYYNWTGSIRVPACCQYAHKMAYLVGQFVKRSTAEELAEKLFYL